MLASDKMTRKLHCAAGSDDAATVFTRMRELNVRHMPVVDGNRLVGILSNRDLLLHASPGEPANFPAGLRVAEVMTHDVISVRGDTPLADIAARMVELRIDAMPITREDGSLVGLVTSTDLLRLVARRENVLLGSDPTEDLIRQYSWDMDLPETVI